MFTVWSGVCMCVCLKETGSEPGGIVHCSHSGLFANVSVGATAAGLAEKLRLTNLFFLQHTLKIMCSV